jgi:hypothetical protein
VITVVLSAVNAVSPQQSIALALPAALLMIGGLVRAAAPDAWTAWQRGFKAGCDTVRQLPDRPEGPGVQGENGPRRERRLRCPDQLGACAERDRLSVGSDKSAGPSNLNIACSSGVRSGVKFRLATQG